MNLRHLLISVCLPLAIVGSACAQDAKGGAFRVGAAKVDITPKASELDVAGDSIRDALYVRAIFIDNGKACAVLVGLDLGGARDQTVNPAIAQASKSTGCAPENFIISATHTHSSNTGGLGQGAPTAATITNAIVSAVESARKRLAPAEIGYGETQVDLNVNRDLFDSKGAWRQAANPQGPSDKTLAVIGFIGEDHVPIAVYMNYAMHPINFYQSGVISADFPGEASRFIERTFGDKAVAIFTQGASGDQNPRMLELENLIKVRTGEGATVETVGGPPPPPRTLNNYVNDRAKRMKEPVPANDVEAYKAAVARTGEWVKAMGMVLGESALDAMRNHMPTTAKSGVIWGGEEVFTCPGRDRLDAANPARENVFPGYKDGADVNLKVGLVRIGDINLARVNGEVYNMIAQRLKLASPANKTVMVTLANGAANSGYIYTDDAYSHLTFQVISSRLKPGCAEDAIIGKSLDLMHKAGQ
jgi:neutral ceramidase